MLLSPEHFLLSLIHLLVHPELLKALQNLKQNLPDLFRWHLWQLL
jgi:hypothetical protein